MTLEGNSSSPPWNAMAVPVLGNLFRPYHDQKHLESVDRLDCMRFIRRHYDHLPFLHVDFLTSDSDVCFAF
jgi:hypothetical protein